MSVLYIIFIMVGGAYLVLSRLGMVPLRFAGLRTIFMGVAAFGLVLYLLDGLFFYADPGTAYAVQFPLGGQKKVTEQGISYKGFGRLLPFQFEIPFKYMIPKEDGTYESHENVHTEKALQWEFNDAVKGYIGASIVFALDVNNDSVFLNLADKNKTEDKLVYSRLLPNINGALKNTAKLMAAQEYISGKSSDFDRYFKDQLEKGTYVLEEYTDNDIETIGDTAVNRKVSSSRKVTRFRIKMHNGEPVRAGDNSLHAYGIKVTQAVVDYVDWEDSFDNRLKEQKDRVAATQLEKQEAEKEFYRAQKEKAKGEADKTAERAKLEKEQIQKTIDAETQAKVAEFNLIAEKKNLEVSRIKAQREKIESDQMAYNNRQLVSAGLTPEQKAQFEKDTKIGIAAELAKMQLPQVMIVGGEKGKGTNGLMEQILGAEMARQLLLNNYRNNAQ